MNIFEIESKLRSIFEDIEENCGEITEDIEKQLAITEEDFRQKVESYTNVIKTLQYECDAIKAEQKRLKELSDRKTKIVNKLKEILVYAVKEFGDTNSRGTRYYSYGTGEVSIRKSEAVEVNDQMVESLGAALNNIISFNKFANTLDSIVEIHANDMLQQIYTATDTIDDTAISEVNADIKLSIPFRDLMNGNGIATIREVARYSDNYSLSANISKSEIKPVLKENGSAMAGIAKIKQNESLIIK